MIIKTIGENMKNKGIIKTVVTTFLISILFCINAFA